MAILHVEYVEVVASEAGMFRMGKATLARRRAIRREADELIGLFGGDAWGEARPRFWATKAAAMGCGGVSGGP